MIEVPIGRRRGVGLFSEAPTAGEMKARQVLRSAEGAGYESQGQAQSEAERVAPGKKTINVSEP